MTRITEVHDAVVRDREVRLKSGPEAAETRGRRSGGAALNSAAQRCSDDTLYGRRVIA
ncbi:hypothetical protein [Lentzea guizhouensis]|uniref:hypothetical protein n=1 Tax=Lentzea guizhouensis TaxID=1586287 RepID=UPI0012B69BF1|nr:hypothetical protein [Lentzea guizhouensis]